jgi:hypothetical protein
MNIKKVRAKKMSERELDELIKKKIHDPEDRKVAKAFLSVKLSKRQEKELIERSKQSPMDIKKIRAAVIRLINSTRPKSKEMTAQGLDKLLKKKYPLGCRN